ncbi:MAG TPA: hypothetical protein VNN75_01195 [Stellaceae bacterium]|nr:hypothetical protein [Stellaceae bacterium]
MALTKQSLAATYLFAALTYFVFICVVLLPIGNLLSLRFTFETNYNEGWNVYNADRLVHREQIYDDNYWRINNYPIASFLIVGAVNSFLDDLLLSGRLVALVSFAAIGVFAAIAVRRFGGGRTDAVFGAGCAMGFCYLVAPAWIIADDPQTLGEAVILGALVSYIARPPDRLNLLRTAFLVVLGSFIKHNLLAIPIAITLDLALRSPRRVPLWLVSCAGFAAGFLGLTQTVAGGDFIDHLMSPRLFHWYGARYHLMKYLRLFKFPLAAIALGASLVLAADRMILAAWGMISIVSATILSGFEGTSYNMFQDAAVFLGVAAGVMMSELRKSVFRGRLARVLASVLPFLIAQPILARALNVADQVYHGRAVLDADRKRQETFLADARYVSDKQGPAICESLLLCYVAGQPFILDPFNSRQYMLSGMLDQGELILRIAAREFAVIQLRADICDDPATPTCHILHYRQKVDRFTDEVLYAVDQYYVVARRSTFGSFYVPKL